MPRRAGTSRGGRPSLHLIRGCLEPENHSRRSVSGQAVTVVLRTREPPTPPSLPRTPKNSLLLGVLYGFPFVVEVEIALKIDLPAELDQPRLQDQRRILPGRPICVVLRDDRARVQQIVKVHAQAEPAALRHPERL